MIYTIVKQEYKNHTGQSFCKYGGSIKAEVEISSQKLWIKYSRLLFLVSLWLNFALCFNLLFEAPSQTGANICTFPNYYTLTLQFTAICAITSVQYDEGKPLLPNFG
jgi:hypothetical protein